jgi:predicted TIM-barrel fold metal-dependent hydrolase
MPQTAPLIMDLSAIPALDQHAHNLLMTAAAAQCPFAAAFTEGGDPAIVGRFERQTLCYRRSLRDIATLLNCAPTEEALLACRSALGLEKLTELCFRTAHLDAVFLDDGFLPEQIYPTAWHGRFVPVRRILRLETLAQDLLPLAADFGDFVERFRAALDPPPAEVVALKSIAAYRGGLDVRLVAADEAEAHYVQLQPCAAHGPVRLADKPLIDFLLGHALELAARHEIPVQFHTGFGDPDLDLRTANPLGLRPLLEEPRFRRAPIVLLHASYPFAREAGYLASVYPQVYVDFGLAVPLLSVAGMRAAVAMLLELAPTGKVMYSSDAHLIPELFYLGAKWGRTILGEVLEGAVHDGDLSAAEADAVAVAVLRDNARGIHRRAAL